MWGQEVFCCHQHECHRIIPTRVGTRYWWWHYTTTIKDHPHACGDKFTSTVKLTEHTGSSPRVWGQVSVSAENPQFFRIIPTRVGTRYWWWHYTTTIKDHPHACGDKLSRPTPCRAMRGSSPRVWGQVRLCFPNCNGGQIIPTRVGTSC